MRMKVFGVGIGERKESRTMKTKMTKFYSWCSGCIAMTLLVLLSACQEQYLIWSPGGDRAAVLAGDGMRLCDAGGRLSEPLLGNVVRFAWLPDGSTAVLVRANTYEDWNACAVSLGKARAERVAADAAALAIALKSGAEWKKAGAFGEERRKFAQLYAARHLTAELRDYVADGLLKEARVTPFTLWETLLVRIEGTSLQIQQSLDVSVAKTEELRPSTDGAVLAFVRAEEFGPDDSLSLWLQPLDKTATPAVRAASAVNQFPDWTADGKSIAYLQAGVGGESRGGLELGTVSVRRVRVAEGRIDLTAKSEELAGLVMNAGHRVRCLRDGRILFSAAEFILPMTAKDFGEEKEQLYCIDAARQATLVRVIPRSAAVQMPRGLSRFELSPDEKRVIVGGQEGDVVIFTLATGEAEVLQAAGAPKVKQLPGWRTSDEPWYVRRNPESADGKKGRRGEVVVRRGNETVVLSAEWPDAVRDLIVGQ